MSVGLRLSFPENTLQDYDRICKALNFPAEWPDGMIAHGSHEADGGLVVNDVWESRQQFDRCAEQRRRAAMGQAVGGRCAGPRNHRARAAHFLHPLVSW
jgi:hypothetical protein